MDTLSVAEAAALCGVGHNTVGYWIRTRKLRAVRNGKNYLIPRQELLFFLKSSGRDIPIELVEAEPDNPLFRTCVRCWEFWKGSEHGRGCEECIVRSRQVNECFTARETSALCCNVGCNQCGYYREIYLPRIQFIHQFDFPASVYKEFHLWGGNRKWAELCGVPQEQLLGMGIERVFHPDSLQTVISYVKRRKLGDPRTPRSYRIGLKNGQENEIRVQLFVFPLTEPTGTFLMLGEEEAEEPSIERSADSESTTDNS